MNNREFVRKITNSADSYPTRTFGVRGRVYTCVNSFSYHIVRRNSDLYDSMDGLFVDGMTMCWLINLLWNRRIPRLSFDMTGMAADLFAYLDSPENTRSVYFIGTKQEILEKTISRFRAEYPDMVIAGYRNGYFEDSHDRDEAIRAIVERDSDFTVVGIGSPLQERFALDLKNAGYRGVVFTCGGFLHQSARRINYYPEWVDKLKLRAFYRLFHEKGMFPRLYNVLLEFPVLFTYDTIKTKLRI